MIRRPTISTRTDTPFPYTTLFRSAVLGAADRIVFVAQLVEGFVVDPDVLRELELAHQIRTDDEGRDTALDAILGRTVGQCRAVGRTAPDHPAAVHVVRRVARVEPPGVRTQRAGLPVRIHLLVVEVVRSDERRVGKECVSKGRSRWSP